MIKRWNILPDAGTEAQALAKALGVSDVLARLLWNRGLRTVDDAQRFLDIRPVEIHFVPVWQVATRGLVEIHQLAPNYPAFLYAGIGHVLAALVV